MSSAIAGVTVVRRVMYSLSVSDDFTLDSEAKRVERGDWLPHRDAHYLVCFT